jgi:DNA-binding YbaB/EbfC family protein
MNIRQMMKQAQAMQDKVQADLSALRVEGESGGGAVKVVLSGTREFLSCDINRELVDGSDLEMLQDLVVAAARDAGRKVDEAVEKRTASLLGGMMRGI